MFFNNMHHMQGQTRSRNTTGTRYVFRNGDTFVYSNSGNMFNFGGGDSDEDGPFVFRQRGRQENRNIKREVRQNTTSVIISCVGQLISLFLVFVLFIVPYLFPTRY
jgi:hypothetical protein